MAPKAPKVQPGTAATWLLAARLPTLSAGAAPVVVGSALALREQVFDLGLAAAALVAAVAIQVGANLANDRSDFKRGADTDSRIGPSRVTQLGLLSERQVLSGIVVSFGLASLIGLWLAYVAGWPVLAIGLASILAAVAYTGGPWPFGYRGLGDLFVFIFFGMVAVCGTYYVQAQDIPAHVLAAAVPVSLTVTAILVVNNVRDIETDRAAGKYTMAVYLGRRLATYQYVLFLACAYLSTAVLFLSGAFSGWTLLSWLSIPIAVSPAVAVLTKVEGPPLNAALRATARLHLIFAILLAVGLSQ